MTHTPHTVIEDLKIKLSDLSILEIAQDLNLKLADIATRFPISEICLECWEIIRDLYVEKFNENESYSMEVVAVCTCMISNIIKNRGELDFYFG